MNVLPVATDGRSRVGAPHQLNMGRGPGQYGHRPRQSSWAMTGGQVVPIRGPRPGPGIERGGHDIHDHITSVRSAPKRLDLRSVREDRQLKGFYAEQFAARQKERAASVAQLHEKNAASAKAEAECRWGAAAGRVDESKARLAQEVCHNTGVNTTQALTLLARNGWSIASAVQAFTVYGTPPVPDVGTLLAPTATVNCAEFRQGSKTHWHPHASQSARVEYARAPHTRVVINGAGELLYGAESAYSAVNAATEAAVAAASTATQARQRSSGAEELAAVRAQHETLSGGQGLVVVQEGAPTFRRAPELDPLRREQPPHKHITPFDDIAAMADAQKGGSD